MKDCRFCGKSMHDGDSFCPHCMRRQDEPDSLENTSISQPIFHMRHFCLVLIGIGTLGVLALLAWGRTPAVSDSLSHTTTSTTPETETVNSATETSVQIPVQTTTTAASSVPTTTKRATTAQMNPPTTGGNIATVASETSSTTVSITESTITPPNKYISPPQIIAYLRTELEKFYGHVLYYTETTENLRPHTVLIATQDAYEGSRGMESLLDQATSAVHMGSNPLLDLQSHWYYIAFQGQQEERYLFTVYERLMPIPPFQIDDRNSDDVVSQVVENISPYIQRIDGYLSEDAVTTGYGFGVESSSEHQIQALTAYFLEAIQNGCIAFDLAYDKITGTTIKYTYTLYLSYYWESAER